MQRTRRDLIGVAGLSLSALTAGCLGRSESEATPTVDGTATERPTETETATLPDGLSRVDEPPYDITQPDCGDPASEDGGRDPLYLCSNMATEPSLAFTQAHSRGNILAGGGLTINENSTEDQCYATVLADADRLAEDDESEPAQLVRETDFDSHAVLVVQTGWGSGSVYPHVERVESTAAGVHAFGCHSDPCVYTDDLTMRTTAVRFERPAELTTGVVSLTVAPEERWNVAAGEGVVTIPD